MTLANITKRSLLVSKTISLLTAVTSNVEEHFTLMVTGHDEPLTRLRKVKFTSFFSGTNHFSPEVECLERAGLTAYHEASLVVLAAAVEVALTATL